MLKININDVPKEHCNQPGSIVQISD